MFIQNLNMFLEESITEQVNRFRQGEKIEKLEDKNVLIVDEGINTGLDDGLY